ncbi:MAG: hypothetical protein ABSF90_00745 [Syntrophobacteraceae bacterium]
MSRRAIVKLFPIVTLLFLAQVLAGGATAHFQAEPEAFYGTGLNRIPFFIHRTML